MVTSGTMTTRLQKVQKRGLIERIPNPDDARSMLVKLTGAGRELVEKSSSNTWKMSGVFWKAAR